jgi:hypothetical protein
MTSMKLIKIRSVQLGNPKRLHLKTFPQPPLVCLVLEILFSCMLTNAIAGAEDEEEQAAGPKKKPGRPRKKQKVSWFHFEGIPSVDHSQ